MVSTPDMFHFAKPSDTKFLFRGIQTKEITSKEKAIAKISPKIPFCSGELHVLRLWWVGFSHPHQNLDKLFDIFSSD